MNDLFELPSVQIRKRFAKAGAYDESKHPRDAHGRWSAGGIAGGAAAIGAGLVGAAAMGVPGLRHVVPGVRRAILGARIRGAQRAMGDPLSAIRQGAPGLNNVSQRTLRAATHMFSPHGQHERMTANAIRGLTGRQSAAAMRRGLASARR